MELTYISEALKLNSISDKTQLISVVCTIYNSADSVSELIIQVQNALNKTGKAFELILVDDCSYDKSWLKIEEAGRVYPFVKGIKLSRNFGQQLAMSAGIEYAKGDIVIIMDGDLQNPPEVIPELINKIHEGNDIVYTVSKIRNTLWDSFSSAFFWFILTKIIGLNIIKNQLMLKAMTREFAAHFGSYSEINRTITGIVHDIGMKYAIVNVENKKRHSGKSNYNFMKRLMLFIDIVISLSTAPLSYMILSSFIILFFTIIASLYYLIMFFLSTNVPGFTSKVLLELFFGSTTVLMLGFIGKYLANIYTEVKRRPLFIVHKTVNTSIEKIA